MSTLSTFSSHAAHAAHAAREPQPEVHGDVRLTDSAQLLLSPQRAVVLPQRNVYSKHSNINLRTVARLLGQWVLALPLLWLAGCYVPLDFELDIRLTRNGDLAVRLQGQLLSTALAQKLVDGEVTDVTTPEEADFVKVVGPYVRDLEKTKGFKEVKYLGKGVFQAQRVDVTNLLQRPYYVMLTRLNRILTVQFDPEKNLVVFTGSGMDKLDFRRMTEADLKIKGRVRLITDLKMLNHNASQVLNTKVPAYDWFIDSERTSTAPFAVVALDPNAPLPSAPVPSAPVSENSGNSGNSGNSDTTATTAITSSGS